MKNKLITTVLLTLLTPIAYAGYDCYQFSSAFAQAKCFEANQVLYSSPEEFGQKLLEAQQLQQNCSSSSAPCPLPQQQYQESVGGSSISTVVFNEHHYQRDNKRITIHK